MTIFDEQMCPDGIRKCLSSSTCCPNKYICNEDDLTCQLNGMISIENEILNYFQSSNVIYPSSQTLYKPPLFVCGLFLLCHSNVCFFFSIVFFN